MENFYRTFLPEYNNSVSNITKTQIGGKVTRFGSVLSGNSNINVLRGSPTGGAAGILNKNLDPAKIGGGKSKSKSKKMKGGSKGITQGDSINRFINPTGTMYHTQPYIGSTIAY